MTTLAAAPARTGVMVAAVAVGIAVLSAAIVVTRGSAVHLESLVAKHGLDMLMVRAGGEVQVFAPRSDRGLSVLFEEDASAILQQVPGIVMASPVQNQRGISVVNGDRSVVTRAFGVNENWLEIRRWGVARGEFISADDVGGLSRVVLLGAKVARDLFPDGDAVGSVVRVQNDPYTVKGVFIEMGASAGGDDWDDRIVVPSSTSSRRLFNRPYLEQVVMRVADARTLPATAERVRSVIRVRHGIGAGEPDDFFVREPEDVEESATQASASMLWLLIALGIVAVAAAGAIITIAMLGAMRQRTAEIGLRRATGASAADIRQEVMIETLIIVVAGGVPGVAFGVALATALSGAGLALARVDWVTFAGAAIACALLAVVCGAVPARAAAAMEPATAVRNEV
jgi:putative ABC transport system permease protein